jgi:hypothetical protein
MKFKVRPVERFIERPASGAARVCGRLDWQYYILSVDSATFSIPILERGADQYGQFAIVDDGEFAQRGGFVIRIAIDISSVDIEPGCCIELVRPRRNDMNELIEASDEEPRELALHPREDRRFSICFLANGLPGGVIGPTRVTVEASPTSTRNIH